MIRKLFVFMMICSTLLVTVGLHTFQAKADDLSHGYKGTQIFPTIFPAPDPAEPLPCGKSVVGTYWFSFSRSSNFYINLSTIGSVSNDGLPLDTVLQVYTLKDGVTLPKSYSDFQRVGCNDNYGNKATSYLDFVAYSQKQYYVQLGIKTKSNNTQLNWSATDCATISCPIPSPSLPVY